MQANYRLSSQILKNAIDLAVLDQLKQKADKWYTRIDDLSKFYGPFEIEQHLPKNTKFLPTASSIALNAVMPPHKLIRALSVQVKHIITTHLGDDSRCNTDISWLRRQYPASFKKSIATPHGWHQDGAYGLDFSDNNHKNVLELLPMITVWLPLHECGLNAPGIELIQSSPSEVLLPEQLQESEIEKRWPVNTYWRPHMQPGDALIIANHTLHRTYQTSAMTEFRGCVELRFLSSKATPKRLMRDNYLSL